MLIVGVGFSLCFRRTFIPLALLFGFQIANAIVDKKHHFLQVKDI